MEKSIEGGPEKTCGPRPRENRAHAGVKGGYYCVEESHGVARKGQRSAKRTIGRGKKPHSSLGKLRVGDCKNAGDLRGRGEGGQQ